MRLYLVPDRPVVRTIVFAVAVAIVLVASPHGANPAPAQPDPERARELVRQGIARAIRIFQSHDLPRAEISERLRLSLREDFDVAAIARYALGVHRKRIRARQFTDYLAAFENLIVETFTGRILVYGPRIKTDISDIIKVTDTVAVGRREMVVRSHVNRKDAKWMRIDWRIHVRDGRPRIIDVVIVGISQAQLYRQEFSSVIRRRGKGIDGLIEALREKNAKLRSQ